MLKCQKLLDPRSHVKLATNIKDDRIALASEDIALVHRQGLVTNTVDVQHIVDCIWCMITQI